MRRLRKDVKRLLERTPATLQIILRLRIQVVTIRVHFVAAGAEVFRRQRLSNRGEETRGEVCGDGRCQAELPGWRLGGEVLPWGCAAAGDVLGVRCGDAVCMSWGVDFLGNRNKRKVSGIHGFVYH